MRRWRVVLLIWVLALIGAVAGLLVMDRDYSATATLQLPIAIPGASGVSTDDLEYTDRLVNTYESIAGSGSLEEEVTRTTGAAGLELRFEPQPQTQLIDLTAIANEPAVAEEAANVAAGLLVERVRRLAPNAESAERINEQIRDLEARLIELRAEAASAPNAGEREGLSQEVRLLEARHQAYADQAAAHVIAADAQTGLSVFQEAESAEKQTLLSSWQKLVFAVIVGLLAGIALAFFLEWRSPQLVEPIEIERAMGAEVVAAVPSVPEAKHVVGLPHSSPGQESFRSLRARLVADPALEPPVSIAVTSAAKGDGKTFIAANLAAALARSRRRVVVVDTDLETKRLSRALGFDEDTGLTAALAMRLPEPSAVVAHQLTRRAKDELTELTVETSVPSLDLLPAGREAGRGRELLASAHMVRVVTALKEIYDYVIIDSVALGSSSDAATVASIADAVLFVVPRSPAKERQVVAAGRELTGVGANVAGVIMNRSSHARIASPESG